MIEDVVLTLLRLKIQEFYDDFRRDVETVLSPPSVDRSSIISKLPEGWRDLIDSALEIIRDGVDPMDDATEDDAMDDTMEDDAMDDATGADAMADAMGDDVMDDAVDDATEDEAMSDARRDDVTIGVDEVLDKLVDNVIAAYGSSARDVYLAIRTPGITKQRITDALATLDYEFLRRAITNIGRVNPEGLVPHIILLMDPTRPVGNAHIHATTPFMVRFKSGWIKSMILEQLSSLQHIKIAVMIQDMASVSHSTSFAGFLYEGFAVNELAAGTSPGLVLKKMKTNRTTTFFVPKKGDEIASPFNRTRERLHAVSDGPLALKFDIPPGKHISDYFWIPVAQNNPLFDAFVIEFNDSAPENSAVVWILQMTLSRRHRGSSVGYSIIKSIKKAALEAMGTTGKRKVIVRYVLVSPDAGRWKLPETKWESCKGDVYYQCLDHRDKTRY